MKKKKKNRQPVAKKKQTGRFKPRSETLEQKNALDRETARQLRLGREFMKEYREVFAALAKI